MHAHLSKRPREATSFCMQHEKCACVCTCARRTGRWTNNNKGCEVALGEPRHRPPPPSQPSTGRYNTHSRHLHTPSRGQCSDAKGLHEGRMPCVRLQLAKGLEGHCDQGQLASKHLPKGPGQCQRRTERHHDPPTGAGSRTQAPMSPGTIHPESKRTLPPSPYTPLHPPPPPPPNSHNRTLAHHNNSPSPHAQTQHSLTTQQTPLNTRLKHSQFPTCARSTGEPSVSRSTGEVWKGKELEPDNGNSSATNNCRGCGVGEGWVGAKPDHVDCTEEQTRGRGSHGPTVRQGTHRHCQAGSQRRSHKKEAPPTFSSGACLAS